jgi:hypothetical protein
MTVPALCARRRPAHRWPKRRVALACALAIGAACTDRLPDQDLRIIQAVPVERVSAALLWQDFQTDARKARSTYRGKAVLVTGEVTQLGSEAPDGRYLYFAQTDAAGVRAYLLDEQAESILAAAKETPRVVLKCFCEGMATDVVLRSCIAAPQ